MIRALFTYTTPEGAHTWSDGTAMNYEAWAPGEPTDPDGSELCVHMYTSGWPGLWNDVACGVYLDAVCKAEKGTGPPLSFM